MYRKNTAGQNLGFAMVSTAGAAGTGLTVAVSRVIDGGSQAAATGTVTEKGGGQYNFAPSQADTNGNQISFLFTASGAVPTEKTIVTTAADPTSAANFGLTNLDAAISTRSTFAGGAVASVTGAVGSVTGSVGSVAGAVGSVTGNVGGNVVGSVGSVAGAVASVTAGVTVTTNNDKTGYALGATGLDSISTTAPTGLASNFREMSVQVWRRLFKKAARTPTQLFTYADNGTTVLTTQTISDDGAGTESQGAAS